MKEVFFFFTIIKYLTFFICYTNIFLMFYLAQSGGAVEYTDCISAEE